MISKDLFKSHPVPVQAAFRISPWHLFHFCIICIFKRLQTERRSKWYRFILLYFASHETWGTSDVRVPSQRPDTYSKVHFFFVTLRACVWNMQVCSLSTWKTMRLIKFFPWFSISPGVPCNTCIHADFRSASSLFSGGCNSHFWHGLHDDLWTCSLT